jgi:hypothetical protein
MKQTIYRFSLWAAGVLIILGLVNWFLVAGPLGYRAAEIVGYLSMILSLSIIFLAIRHFRTQYGNGTVTFGQGFKIGMMITLIASAVFFVYTVVYFQIWGEDFMKWAQEHYQSSMSAAEYQQFTTQIAEMGSLYQNPFFQGMVMFFTVFFIGLIISLIAATVLKRR